MLTRDFGLGQLGTGMGVFLIMVMPATLIVTHHNRRVKRETQLHDV